MSTTTCNASADELYVGDRYLELTGGTWHLEDAEFKATYIDKILRRNKLAPRTVCELGCGAGGVLAALQKKRAATYRT